jgi:hypothetical protein
VEAIVKSFGLFENRLKIFYLGIIYNRRKIDCPVNFIQAKSFNIQMSDTSANFGGYKLKQFAIASRYRIFTIHYKNFTAKIHFTALAIAISLSKIKF